MGRGASAANAGGISLATKQQGPPLQLALLAVQRFSGLAEELEHDIEYERIPSLTIAETETEWSFLRDLVAQQRKAGATVDLLDGEQSLARCPGLAGAFLGASYSEADAQVNPFQLTYAFARKAEQRGAEIFGDTPVESLDIENGRLRGVRTASGTVRADWVVNAAGAYSPFVGKMAGVEHAVLPQRGQAIAIELAEDFPQIRVGCASHLVAKHGGTHASSHCSFSYSPKARLGIGQLGGTTEFVGYDTSTTREALAEITAQACRLLPCLGPLRVLRCWAGLRPHHDGGPIIGQAGGPEGYIAATGHGGDGVSLSPITGEYVAEMIKRSDSTLPLEALLAASIPSAAAVAEG